MQLDLWSSKERALVQSLQTNALTSMQRGIFSVASTVMAEIDSDSDSGHKLMIESSLPLTKKSKRNCHFDPGWIKEFQGLGKSSKGKFTNYI